MNLPKTISKKSIYIGLGILLSAGVLGTAAFSLQSTSEPKTEVTKKIESSDKKISDKSNRKKENNSKKTDIAEDTLKKYDVELKNNQNSVTGFSSSLTPKEMQLVAAVIKEQTKEAEKVIATANPTEVAPPVLLPNLPDKPTKPVEPILPPVIETSKPTIHYQEGIVIVKDSIVDPMDYFNVVDSLDPNVAVYVDTTGLDTSNVGDQSFLVIATNKFNETTVAKVPVFVASIPSISLSSTAVELKIGESFNPTDWVTAWDEIEGDLSSRVMISSQVNTEVEGIYNVWFEVTTSYGISARTRMSVRIVNAPPRIYAPTVYHEIDQPFNPLDGVLAKAYNGEIILVSENDIVENTVDPNTEGSYKVVYQVRDRFGKASEKVERLVIVQNHAPVLHGIKDLSFHVGTNITLDDVMDGVTATDREDDKNGLPLEVNVNMEQFNAIQTEQEGVYPLTYTVVDSHGKETNQEINVTIINDAPIIHGIVDVEIDLNSSFDPLEGVTVTDTEDGDILTSTIEVTNLVDTSTPGVYEVTYQVVDRHGKASKLYVRTVTVKEVIELPEVEEPVLPEVPPSEENINLQENKID